jgi:hypothetical protein
VSFDVGFNRLDGYLLQSSYRDSGEFALCYQSPHKLVFHIQHFGCGVDTAQVSGLLREWFLVD